MGHLYGRSDVWATCTEGVFQKRTVNDFRIKHGEQMCFFQIDIIINVFVSSFRFNRIPMLWDYGHYKYLILSVRKPTLDVRI